MTEAQDKPPLIMKKTLFLSALFSLGCMSTFAAYDALRPQEIINIADGETVHASDAGFVVDMTQFNTGVTTSERTAIIKDGQGTFVLNENTIMHCPLVVREGTMLIGGKGTGEENRVTVYDYPHLESPVFTVGGINAKLELDNAALGSEAGKKIDESGHSYTTSYVAAICVGGRDGDGTLTLKNGSQMSNVQSLFAGTISWSGTLSGDAVNSHVCGSYVSAEGSELYRDKAIAEGGFSGYVNTSKSAAVSKASINIESGSELKLGTGFNVGNAIINIDNAILSTGNRVENSDFTKLGFVGSGGAPETYVSKTIVNITNGGKFLDNNVGYSAAWKADVGLKIDEGGNSYNEINISENSAWESKGYAEISFAFNGNGTNLINISDGSHMSIGEYACLGYGGSLIHIDLKDNSYFEVQGDYLQMGKNSSVSVDETSSLRSNKLTMLSGSSVVNNGTMSGLNDESGKISINNGASLENHGLIQAETIVNGTLSGNGIMGATTINNGASLIVGNSPGLQTFTGDVSLAAGSVTTFSVTSVMTPATDELQGWDSACHSQIRMDGAATFTVADGAAFVITFGGDLGLESASSEEGLSFDMILVHGGVSPELVNLSALSENTRFAVTEEEGGVPALPVTIRTDNLYYTVENSNLVLHGVLYITPEPTTATLSLLALAGLAARRRRK